MQRAAALGALLENLRISGNRKCHAYLLQYPKDVVSLPWEQLGGTDDWHQLPKLFAGEVWDGRVDRHVFLQPKKHDCIILAIRQFVVSHSGSASVENAASLANALKRFRSVKRGNAYQGR